MAKTAAEKQKAYRDRRRHQRNQEPKVELDGNAHGNGNAPDVTVTRPENVMVPKRDAPSVTIDADAHLNRFTVEDLPADVQAEIEKHCSENNNGARAGSHSRAAMTERALKYHGMRNVEIGGAPLGKPTGVCQVCGGPVQHPTIVKCLKCCTGTPAPRDPRRTAAELQYQREQSGPLSVYGPKRWAYLQSKGYVWDEDIGYAALFHAGQVQVGVTVPGDPAYQGT